MTRSKSKGRRKPRLTFAQWAARAPASGLPARAEREYLRGLFPRSPGRLRMALKLMKECSSEVYRSALVREMRPAETRQLDLVVGILYRAGLISKRRYGREVAYSLSCAGARRLIRLGTLLDLRIRMRRRRWVIEEEEPGLDPFAEIDEGSKLDEVIDMLGDVLEEVERLGKTGRRGQTAERAERGVPAGNGLF